jgi:hypothetical protein
VAARFRATRHGPAVRLSAGESALIGLLLTELMTLLAAEEPDTSAVDPLEELTGMTDTHQTGVRPSDPVLARLLPDAYADDEERATEFRRYTEDELRSGKRAGAQMVLESLPPEGGRVVLGEALTDAWLSSLNDLRLALGTRLEVTDDSPEEFDHLDPTSQRGRELTVYLWLGWLQETLVDTQLH